MPNEVQYTTAKSILSKLKHPDPYFGISYNMNLYRGCQHGCIYCDTRSDCYGVGHINNIFIKDNAIELLNKELSSKRRKKATVGTGSMNDPYMPIEATYQATRNALQVVATHKYPVHIITKGKLVMRDYDVLQEISKTYAAVSFTITTADDELARKVEPRAPSSSQRFEAMNFLAKKGIYTGVTLMPILPFVNDTVENIETIMHRAKDAGASYILPMFGVTLRSGSREFLYQSFDQHFHGLKEKYEATFGERYECISPNYQQLAETFRKKTAQLGIASKITFYSPPDAAQQLALFK